MVSDALPKKRISFDSVMAMIFLVVFLVMLLINFIYYRYIHCFNLALFLLPTGFFYFLHRYLHKRSSRKAHRVVIRTISIIVSVIFVFINFAAMYLNDLINPVSDPIYYQHLMQMYDYGGDEWTDHFPKIVPVGAKNVKFFDGGSDFLLKYDTTSADIKRIISEYEGKAKVVIEMDKYNSGQYVPAQDIFFPAFYSEITGDDTQGLPDDFHLLILNNRPGSDGEAWNHGSSSGIAVSIQRCEVIYWYEWA